jgi:hypothetical protein
MSAYLSPCLTAGTRQTRRRWALALLAPVFALAMLGTAAADDRDDNDKNDAYVIGLWGDLPYSPAQSTVGCRT